ncbi:MAG TPA: hypothetical protein VM869_23990 [Enhygromyxa sp.]|nr:hypothetical protein [Enhygromyxa sp.]
MAGRGDVEALSRSFRSRILLLVLLLLLGLAAAVWTSLREAGIGAPEDRRRVMVVTDGSAIDYYAVLERGGFDVEVDELEDWLRAARAAAPESEADGVALVLEHADRQGVALVVFERPSDRDWSALDWVELELAPIERLDEREYAAVSVGDFAFPHRLTMDEPGDDPLVRLPGHGALQAIFRQALISARESPERPSVAELQFEDATKLAREMVERPSGFAGAIAQARSSVEGLLDDGSGSRTLVPMLGTGTAITTPDGGLLLFHHELVIYSDDARTLELEAAAQMQLSWVSPAAVLEGIESGVFERSPCTSLAGGAISMAERPRIDTAADGSAIAIASPEGGATVWGKTEAPGCEWESVAEIDRMDGVVLAPRSAGSEAATRSLAARVEHSDDASRVLLWTVGEGGLLDLQRVIQQAQRRFSSIAFLDDRHLAVTSAAIDDGEQAPEDRVYVLDRSRPDLYLSVPVEFFAEGRRLRDVIAVAPASERAGPELIVTARNPLGQLELIHLRVGLEAWEAFASAEVDEAQFGVEGTMVSLTPAQLSGTILAEADSLLGVDVRAGALIFASDEGPRSGELMWVDLASGERRQLTDNWIRDYLPRLSSDGSYATFVSLMQVNLAPTPFSVPRVLPLRAKK